MDHFQPFLTSYIPFCSFKKKTFSNVLKKVDTFRTTLDNFGPIWTKLDQFGPI